MTLPKLLTACRVLVLLSLWSFNNKFGSLGGNDMRRLHIQIQPARSPELDVQAAVARLKELAAESRVIEGFDKVAYVNVDLRSPDFPNLWALVQEELTNDVPLKKATIVVCEGQRGWEDYLLLHHYDPAQPLEALR